MLQHFRRVGSRGVTPVAMTTLVLVSLAFGAAFAQSPSAQQAADQDVLLRYWPVLMVAAGCVAYAVRCEVLAKSAAKDLQTLREEFNDKLTNYATTAEVADVRGQVLVALSKV